MKDNYKIETNYINRDGETPKYQVKVIDNDGSVIYNEKYYEHEYNIYKEYIDKRVEILLQDCGKLHKPYIMFEVGNRMYRLDDLDYTDNHRNLVRCALPIDYYEDDSIKFDLMLTGGLYDFFTYQEDILVYRFGSFYLNGELVGAYEDINKEYDLSTIDLDFAYGKNFDDFIKYIEDRQEVKLKGYRSIHCDCDFE